MAKNLLDGEKIDCSIDEDKNEICLNSGDAIQEKIITLDSEEVNPKNISSGLQELSIKYQRSPNLSLISHSPVDSFINQWEKECALILTWDSVLFTKQNGKFPNLPSLVMEGTIYNPNEQWDKLLAFEDYKQYRERFHVLYRLELFQQIVTGILSTPLSQNVTNKLHEYSGELFYIKERFGNRIVIERPFSHQKNMKLGKHDLVLLSNNERFRNGIFGIVENIDRPINHRNRGFIEISEDPEYERYEIIYQGQIPHADNIFVQHVTPLIVNSRQIQALEDLKSSPLLESLLNPSLICHSLEKAFELPKIDELNNSQLEAVHRIVNDVKKDPRTPRIALVHGPPGTGKSTTILHLVKFILSQTFRRGQIVVCAASNAAVDAIAVKLIKSKVCFTRVGGDRISSEVVDHSLTNQFNKGGYKRRAELLACQKVILCTISGCGSESMRQGVKPSIIIVDEACQTSELELIIALQLGCERKNGCNKLVLVGDHHQLPPTVMSKRAENLHLDLSFFDRCRLNLENRKAMDKMMLLNIQYRMVEPIAHFPSEYVYDNKIVTPAPGETGFRENPPGFPLLSFKFIDTNKNCGNEEKEFNSTSFINKTEAAHVLKVCQEILECAGLKKIIKNFEQKLEINEDKESEKEVQKCVEKKTEVEKEEDESWGIQKNIGVISFYKAQVGHIKKILVKNDLRGMEVNTVDGFQGREKQIIIVSCVRTNMNSIGFLGNDYRRMNVAITRAKLGLYIIGCADSLKRSEHWRCLIKSADHRQFLSRCNVDHFPHIFDLEIVKELRKEKAAAQSALEKKNAATKKEYLAAQATFDYDIDFPLL